MGYLPLLGDEDETEGILGEVEGGIVIAGVFGGETGLVLWFLLDEAEDLFDAFGRGGGEGVLLDDGFVVLDGEGVYHMRL